jgi:hypothetical protein
LPARSGNGEVGWNAEIARTTPTTLSGTSDDCPARVTDHSSRPG